MSKTALVLSGGGALGAYELGIVKALVNGKSPSTRPHGYDKEEEKPIPLDPHIFTGTSIGSFNASYLVSHWDTYGAAGAGKLESVWLGQLAEGRCGNGGYRIRLNPLELFNPFCYLQNPLLPISRFAQDSAFVGRDMIRRFARFATPGKPILNRVIDLINISTFISTSPWERVIKEQIDFEALRKSVKSLSIAATNWTTGEVRIFRKAKMSEEFGPKVIRASSAIPGFYPPQIMGTQEFVDGGLLMNTPLKPAIKEGGQILHVINMNADIVNVAISDPPNSMETMYRQQLIGWATALDRDIARVASYNRAIDILKIHEKIVEDSNSKKEEGGTSMSIPELEDFMAAYRKHGIDPSFHDMVLAHSILEKQKKRREMGKKAKLYKKLTIHRYYPIEPLGGMLSLLDLNAKFFADLIEQGFSDAVSHDCEVCGCVLPGSPGPGPV